MDEWTDDGPSDADKIIHLGGITVDVILSLIVPVLVVSVRKFFVSTYNISRRLLPTPRLLSKIRIDRHIPDRLSRLKGKSKRCLCILL